MFFHTRSISLKVLQLHFPSLFPRELFLRLQVYIFSSSSQQLKVIPLQAKKKKKNLWSTLACPVYAEKGI